MKTKIIKEIKIYKRKVKIIFSDDSILEILPETYTNFLLFKNKELSLKEIEEIKEDNKRESLFDFISKKINLKNVTSGKAREMLLEKCKDGKIVDLILKRLIDSKFINDQAFVDEVFERADYKHFGFNKIINKLYEIKVSHELIKQLEIDEEREKNEAEILIKESLRKYENKNNVQRKKSLYSLLLRNGFSSSLSLELVNKISNSNEKSELNVLKLDYRKAKGRYSKKYHSYELTQRIENYLLSKGYRYDDIKQLEDLTHEMD